MDNKCTLFPNGDWLPCCVGHDYDYADGGNINDKIKSDWNLSRCVVKRSKMHKVKHLVAAIMFIGLSIGGYFNFRWT